MSLTAKIVEIARSKYGYGFTLSGEMPCRLTQVKGHASTAGLKSGDRLNAVNGQNVELLGHDEVVELITSADSARLVLHVTSVPRSVDDSSEEDEDGENRDILDVNILHNDESEPKQNAICFELSSNYSSDSDTSSSNASSTYGVVGGSSNRHLQNRSHRHHQQNRQHSRCNQSHSTGQQQRNPKYQPNSQHLISQSNGHQKRPHRHANNNHHQNILRPSQTYEPKPPSRPSKSLSTKPLHNYQNSADINHRQQRYNRDLKCKSNPLPSNVNIGHSSDNLSTSERCRQSTEMINCVSTVGDDELLQLHQHYRNRLKCSKTNREAVADDNGSRSNTASSSNCGTANSRNSNNKENSQHNLESSMTRKCVQPKVTAKSVSSNFINNLPEKGLEVCQSQYRTGNSVSLNQVSVEVDIHHHPSSVNEYNFYYNHPTSTANPSTNETLQVTNSITDNDRQLPSKELRFKLPNVCSNNISRLNRKLQAVVDAKQQLHSSNTNYRSQHTNGHYPSQSIRSKHSTTSGVSSTSPSSSSNSTSPASTTSRQAAPASPPPQGPHPVSNKQSGDQCSKSSYRSIYHGDNHNDAINTDLDCSSGPAPQFQHSQMTKPDCVLGVAKRRNHHHQKSSTKSTNFGTNQSASLFPNGSDVDKTEQQDSEDCHSEAIFRSIVLCLSISKHHFDCGTRRKPPDMKVISEIIPQQLAVASGHSTEGHDALQSMIPVLIAAYTDEIYLVSAPPSVAPSSSSGTTSLDVNHKQINFVIKSNQILQCGLMPNDSSYFALLVKDNNAGAQESAKLMSSRWWCRCFVFMVNRTYALSHQNHLQVAQRFGLNCTAGPINSNCLEFSENAEQILRVIFTLYRKQLSLMSVDNPTKSAGLLSPQSVFATTPTVNQRNQQQSIKTDPLSSNSSSCRVADQSLTDPKQPDLIEHNQYLIDDADDLRLKSMSVSTTNQRLPSDFNLLPATSSLLCPAVGNSSVPSTVPIRPKRSPRRAQTLALMPPPPPPLPLPSSTSRKLDCRSLPAVVVDPNEDSSPSCCATTSCDSFSFQQFQQHIQQQQNSHHNLQSHASNMRPSLVDPPSSSSHSGTAAGSIGIIQIDCTKQTAANQTYIASHTALAPAVEPNASDDYRTNTNNQNNNNNNNNRRAHAAATVTLSQQSTELGSENFLLQQAQHQSLQQPSYHRYSEDGHNTNSNRRSILSYPTTAALLPPAPSQQLLRASNNPKHESLTDNVYLQPQSHQHQSYNQQSQQIYSNRQAQLSPNRVSSHQPTVSNLPASNQSATSHQFSSPSAYPNQHPSHQSFELVSADQQSISAHQLAYRNQHPRPRPIKSSQSCYQLFVDSNPVVNHYQPHHFNLQQPAGHRANAGSLLNCASVGVGVDSVPFSTSSPTTASSNADNRFDQYPYHQLSYRHPKPKRFHTLYHNVDHQSTPLGLDQLPTGDTNGQLHYRHQQRPLPAIFSPLLHSLSKTPSSILFSSHNDLSFNSHQLEAQFSPSNVRQATQKYLKSCFATNNCAANSLLAAPVANGQRQSLTVDQHIQTNQSADRLSYNHHHHNKSNSHSYRRMDPNRPSQAVNIDASGGRSGPNCDISSQQTCVDSKGSTKLVRCSGSKSSLVDNGNASAFTAGGGTSSLDSDSLSGANLRPRSSTDTDIDGSQDAHPPTTTEETSDETDGTSSQITANTDQSRSHQKQANLPNKSACDNSNIFSIVGSATTARSFESEAFNDQPTTIKEIDENVADDEAHSKMLMYPCITDEYCWMESPPEFPISERPVDVGWVGGWASDFDILLSDPVGVRAFTDFLRKEFSFENLEFFLALQEFKKLTIPDEIKRKSCEIFDNYISQSALDPVNVDSKARKAAEIAMKQEPITTRTFQLAEKQVYNLMKFDSYQRFLKSDIYKECALLELQGKPLPYEDAANNCDNNNNSSEVGGPSGTAANGTNTAPKQVVKSKRKSLIPWSRIKSSITNNKAASLSSMPSGHKETSSFKRPMMMRKITNSITKIRSKSLDEHITNHINKHAADGGGHSASVDKPVVNQKSLNLGDSRNSLLANNSDSIDLSDTSTNNVFSPSPENKEQTRLAAFANETVDNVSSPGHNSPIKQNSVPIPNTASSFSHNCNRDNCHFLRIIFPDRSQTVVPSTPNETIDSLLRRLIEKRALKYLAYDVFVDESDKPLDLNTNSILLGCTELRVEQRVLFQLELPNQDIVGVKARPSKLCSEVFRPLLLRYGYRPEHITLSIADSNTALLATMPISIVDGQRIIVSYRDDLEEWGWDTTKNNIPVALNSSMNSSLSKTNPSDANNQYSPSSQSQQPNSPSSALASEQANLFNKADAYHNVDQTIDGFVCNNNRFTSTTVCTESESAIPGDDTQSDSFFREILTSAQYVPSPMQSQILPSPSSKLNSQTTPAKSTSSVAYGIVQSNLQSPISQSYHHLNTEPVSSLLAGSSFHPLSIRRYNSINEQYMSRGTKSQTNESDIKHQTQKSNAPPIRANHLRELQNHRNFKSQIECTSNSVTSITHSPDQPSASLDHNNDRNTATRHSFISTQQYPLDLNTTAEEMLLTNKISPVSISSPSINTLPSMCTSVPPPPMPITGPNTCSNSQFAPLPESPEKSPIKRYQSDPPPLPPKSGQICTQIIQTSSSLQSMVPPPRPPPISPNKAKLTSSMSQQQPAPPPYYYNHNRNNNSNSFNLQQTKAATVDSSMPPPTNPNAVVELKPDSYV